MPDIGKVLFVGNSITLRVPKPEFGWYGNWGMAASSQDKDYVHVLMGKIRVIYPGAQHMTLCIADYERKFWDYDLHEMDAARDFGTDLMIMRIGENVAGESAGAHDLSTHYLRLIDWLNPSGSTRIICSTCFWDKPAVNDEIMRAARLRSYELTELTPLSRDESNMAKAEFWHKGVGAHPSDRGMARIAEMLWDTIRGNER